MSSSPVERLLKAVENCQQLLILLHNDPDPDAIGAAVGLCYLLEQVTDIDVSIGYKGIVGRAENKALVRFLNRPMGPVNTAELKKHAFIALVDTQPGMGNNIFPANKHPVIVIDHHPLKEATQRADFYDVRVEAGSTSTLLTGYLRSLELAIPAHIATALFYGIKTDTLGLSRAASKTDADAYYFLQPLIDVDGLLQIERAQVPVSYFKSIAATLKNTRIYDRLLVTYIGQMAYPDLAAEMADFLLRMQDIRWVICIGQYKHELVFSIRTFSKRGAGDLAEVVVGDQGLAGGHGTMAGGHLPLLSDQEAEVLVETIIERALDYLDIEPNQVPASLI